MKLEFHIFQIKKSFLFQNYNKKENEQTFLKYSTNYFFVEWSTNNC